MKVLAASFLITFATLATPGQVPTERLAQSPQQGFKAEVDLELTQTANAYRAGNFAEAQRHAERAVVLDPSNLTAAIFLARVLHQRYKPGDNTPENVDRARAAIAAYQKALTLDAQSEEAYQAIGQLYAFTHQDELLDAWILQRTMNPQVSNEKRAEAYAVMAGRDWDCSYKFTELPNHKIVDPDGKQAVTYKLPAEDVVEFQKIKQCVTSGLEMADASTLLEYENEAAWSYKTSLFLEAAKLAEMEGLDLAKADFEKQAKEAGAQAGRIAEKHRRAGGAGNGGLEIFPRPLPPPPAPKRPPNQ